MQSNKPHPNSKDSTQVSIIQTAATLSSLTYSVRSFTINLFLEKTEFIPKLQSKHPDTKITHLPHHLHISNIPNPSTLATIKKYIEKRLFKVSSMTLKSQNLSNEEYENYMLKNVEIGEMMKGFFEFSRYLDGAVELYFVKSISEEGVMKKQNELEGYKKETLILHCDQLDAFMKYAGEDRKLAVLLQCMREELVEEFECLARHCKLALKNVEINNEKELWFTVIGFKKYYIDFYIAVMDVFLQLKTSVTKFVLDSDDKSQREELTQLIRRQNSKANRADEKLRQLDEYIVSLGSDHLPEDIDLFINSTVKRIRNNFTDASEVEFIQERCIEIRKLIKQQVNYVDGGLKLEQQLTIRTDSKNYEKCVKVIRKFIHEKKENKVEFYFKTDHQKEAFLKYFRDEVKFEVEDAGEEKIVYLASDSNKENIRERLEAFKSLIQNSMRRMLVGTSHDFLRTNKRITINRNIQKVPIGSSSNCIRVDDLDIEISHRVEIEDSDCIVCCYRPQDGEFLDDFIEPYLHINTKNSIMKVTKKKQELPSLHRISEEFCPNLIVHKFNCLNSKKVLSDFNRIFDQTKEDIKNISLIVPTKYENWRLYLGDFLDEIIYLRKEFKSLRRVVIVCSGENRAEVIKIVRKTPFDFSITTPQKLNEFYLLKHQNLSFHRIRFINTYPKMLHQYTFTPLFLFTLHQHCLFKSKGVILSLPINSSTPDEYLADLSSKTFFNTRTKHSMDKKEFMENLMCLNSVLKENIRRKKENKFSCGYVVLYVKENKVAGDCFELVPEEKKLIKLNEKYERTEEEFEFELDAVKTVESWVVEGYEREIEELTASLKFSDAA